MRLTLTLLALVGVLSMGCGESDPYPEWTNCGVSISFHEGRISEEDAQTAAEALSDPCPNKYVRFIK